MFSPSTRIGELRVKPARRRDRTGAPHSDCRKLVVAAVLTLVGCDAKAPPAATSPPVVASEVIAKRIVDWDEYNGRFAAVDSVEVRPRASGYVDRVHFREGQLVATGDVLVTIDPRPYRADFDRAQAELDLAKSQLELSEIE